MPMKDFIKEKCFYVVITLFLITLGLLCFTHYECYKSKKMMEEIEYIDSVNTYHKVYYEKTFSSLKKENKELYDSLKRYKDKVSYLIQFTHEKDYNSGKVNVKPIVKDSIVYDTIKVNETLMAKTYEYTSEPNDTFQYKLNVNSYMEPNWYSFQAKVKNKFTIVNKDEGDGLNHLTIQPNNGGTVSDVTVFKKKEKRGFFERFGFGPSVTAGYDPINKQFGVMVGVGGTFDITK